MWEITEYTDEDLDAAVDLIEAFHVEHLATVSPAFCRESVLGTVERIAAIGTSKILLLRKDGVPVGIAAAVATPSIFNASSLEFTELVWYIVPEFRSRGVMLYKRLLAEAAGMGVEYVRMAYVHNDVKEKVAAFYRAEGFRECETHCVKKL